ncbi:MAG TPA: hypothetical protein VD978_33660 [Azospirillum sp.]|nr:hypothetical protein [Azospirillum sp.]
MTIKIRITAKREGARRGGRAHHGTAIHPLTEFTAEQLEQLRDEGNKGSAALVVAELVKKDGDLLVVGPWPQTREDLQKLLDHVTDDTEEDGSEGAASAAGRRSRSRPTGEPAKE